MAPTPSRPANTRSKQAVDSPLAMVLSASAEKKARAETRRQKALQKQQERKVEPTSVRWISNFAWLR